MQDYEDLNKCSGNKGSKKRERFERYLCTKIDINDYMKEVREREIETNF